MRPIKITYDFSNFSSNNQNYKKVVEDHIIKLVDERLKNIVQIRGANEIPQLDKSETCDNEIRMPEKYYTAATPDVDLLIFFVNRKDELNYEAYAFPCLQNFDDGRPIVGIVAINETHFSSTPETIDNQASTLVHEIIHILAFSPALFPFFKNGNPVRDKTLETDGQKRVVKLLQGTNI